MCSRGREAWRGGRCATASRLPSLLGVVSSVHTRRPQGRLIRVARNVYSFLNVGRFGERKSPEFEMFSRKLSNRGDNWEFVGIERQSLSGINLEREKMSRLFRVE